MIRTDVSGRSYSALSETDLTIPAPLLLSPGTSSAARNCAILANDSQHSRQLTSHYNGLFKTMEATSALWFAVSTGTATQVKPEHEDTRRSWLISALSSTAVFAAFASLDTWYNGEARNVTFSAVHRDRLAHLHAAARFAECEAFLESGERVRSVGGLLGPSTPTILKNQLTELMDRPQRFKGVLFLRALLNALLATPAATGAIESLRDEAARSNPGSATRNAGINALAAALPAIAIDSSALLNGTVAQVNDLLDTIALSALPASAPIASIRALRDALQQLPGEATPESICLSHDSNGRLIVRTGDDMHQAALAELQSCEDEQFTGHGAPISGPK